MPKCASTAEDHSPNAVLVLIPITN